MDCGGFDDDGALRAFANVLDLAIPPSASDTIDLGVVLVDTRRGHPARLRPAHLTGAADPALAALKGCTSGGERVLALVTDLYSGHIARMVALPTPDGDSGQEPAGGAPRYPHNPRTYQIGLVAQVAEHAGLSLDAATLYLQLLALPDPTDRNVARWTGWRAARLRQARAELAASDLVVTATRSRAGRSLFLPGGWVPARSPAIPVERWKLPLIAGGEAALAGDRMALPTVGVPELFATAWQRVLDGDGPRFEEPDQVSRP